VTFKRKLKINGVTLRSVLENLDGSPESQILASLLEGMAAYYSQNLSRECLKGQLENGYKCVHNGGIPPLGYDVDEQTRQYVINEEEAKIVRYIFSKYAEGMGYNTIIANMNDMGWHSKRGNVFGKNSLYDLLKNLKYTGTYTFNMRLEKDVSGTRNTQFKPKDEWIYIEDGMPAIIDRETFDIVQSKLAFNKKVAGCFKTKRVYLLAGLLKCGECGASMWGKSHTDGRHGLLYLNYECSTKTNKQNCRSKGVKKESIENYVLDELQNTLFSENSIKRLASMLSEYSAKTRNESQKELEDAIRELDGIKIKIDRIIQLVADSGISIDTVKDELKRLEERKLAVENYVQEIRMKENISVVSEEMIFGMINKSKELVRARNIPECRNIIGNYVESVIVYRDKVEIKFKIAVPDKDNGALCPLKVEHYLEALKEKYQKAG
jgi:site-specific DNA recombinase